MATRLLLVLVLALLLVAEVAHATRLEDLLARRHKGLRRRRRHHAHGMLAARGTQEFDVEALFAKPPAPPERKRPPFIAPHPKRDRPMNDEDRLMIQRFSSCLERSNATVNDLVIRPSIREYRDQVIKTIPGLTAWLSEGIMRELMSDKGHVVSLTLLYQNRRRNMRFPKPVEVTFSKEPPEHPNDLVRDYLASPDMNGDIAFEYFCKASSPCTMDENCLLSHLMLLSVMGEEDLNSTPDINGTDIKACQVGRYIGDAEGCNKTAPDLCKVPYTMYTVVKGDWLSRIARDHNTTVKAIVKLNPQIKNPDLIYPNQQFRIPRKGCKQSEASLCDDSFKYVVKKGDWLSKIARRYHTTVAIIHNANKDKIKDVDLIYPGQIFDIPKPGCDKPGKPKAPATKCPKHITYEVVKGDNLTKIGKMFGTTWQALHKLNPQIVDPNLIYPRQKLQVPNKECK